MSKSNFEKAVALGGAVTAVFGVLSSLNPHLAYSRVDFIIDTLRTSFVLEFQPLPFTIGLLLSGFGGILGLVAAVKWRGASRLVLRLGSLLGCVGLLVFLFEFYPGLWRIAHARGVFVITFGVVTVHGVGFYLVLFGSLLMLERATMGGILRRIAVGTSATSLALLVLVLCMFFSPPLNLAYPLFLTIVGLLSLLGGLLASIGTALSLVLILRSKKVNVWKHIF